MAVSPAALMESAGEGYMSDGAEAGYQSANGGVSDSEVLEYRRRFDPTTNSWYFVSSTTGESWWAVQDALDWMEVLDPDSQCVYHRHSLTGDTKWPADEQSRTVWEELKDPLTNQHYYYSNANKASQWNPPPWIDYVDPETRIPYYFNVASGESVWQRPAGFVEAAVDDGGELDAASLPALETARYVDGEMATPRIAPLPTTTGPGPSPKRGAQDQEVAVQYSVTKRPRGQPATALAPRHPQVPALPIGSSMRQPPGELPSAMGHIPPSSFPPSSAPVSADVPPSSYPHGNAGGMSGGPLPSQPPPPMSPPPPPPPSSSSPPRIGLGARGALSAGPPPRPLMPPPPGPPSPSRRQAPLAAFPPQAPQGQAAPPPTLPSAQQTSATG